MKFNLNKEQLSNVILGALVVIAVVLGFTLIKGENGEKQNLAERLTPPPTANLNLNPASNLNDDEAAVLLTPSPDASEEERQRHFDLTARLAISASELNLTGCTADPIVFKTTTKSEIKVINDDNVPHEMVFGPDKRYQVPAGGSIRLSDLFEQGPGLYGYGCDALPSAAGLFFVTE